MKTWRSIGAQEFNAILKKWGGEEVYPRVPISSKEFKTNGICIKFLVKNMEYEYSNIGTYHFRDINYGPWSRWTAM